MGFCYEINQNQWEGSMERLWFHFPNKWVELELERAWFEIVFWNDEYFLQILFAPPYLDKNITTVLMHFYIISKDKINVFRFPDAALSKAICYYTEAVHSWMIADSNIIFSVRENTKDFEISGNLCMAKIRKTQNRLYLISVNEAIKKYIGRPHYSIIPRNIDDPDKIELIFVTIDNYSRIFRFKVENGPRKFKVLYNDDNTERIINIPVWHINICAVGDHIATSGIHLKSNNMIITYYLPYYHPSQIIIPLDKLMMEREINTNIDKYKLNKTNQLEFEEYKILLFEGTRKDRFDNTNIFIGSKSTKIFGWPASFK